LQTEQASEESLFVFATQTLELVTV